LVSDAVSYNALSARHERWDALQEIEKCLSPIVVCGPPSVGKSTLIEALIAKYPAALTSCTPYLSREPSKTEKQGEKFNFVKKEEFEAKQAQEGFFFSVAPAAEAGLMVGYSFESIRDASFKGKVTIVETEEAEVAAALQVYSLPCTHTRGHKSWLASPPPHGQFVCNRGSSTRVACSQPF
jgi:hypothetical protein